MERRGQRITHSVRALGLKRCREAKWRRLERSVGLQGHLLRADALPRLARKRHRAVAQESRQEFRRRQLAQENRDEEKSCRLVRDLRKRHESREEILRIRVPG